jgi:hypothetical protein
MDYDKLLLEIKSLNNECKEFEKSKGIYKDLSKKEFHLKLQQKYTNITTNYNSIFQQCINNVMDIEVITFMISKAKEIQKNKVSNYDASVKVGEKLVDKFIKPHLDKEKEKENKD